MLTFVEGKTYGTERPAAATVALIFDSCNVSFCSPVDGLLGDKLVVDGIRHVAEVPGTAEKFSGDFESSIDFYFKDHSPKYCLLLLSFKGSMHAIAKLIKQRHYSHMKLFTSVTYCP